MSSLMEHLEHPSGLRIPIPTPVDDNTVSANDDKLRELIMGGLQSSSTSNSEESLTLRSDSFDMPYDKLCMEGPAAGDAQQLLADTVPITSARSPLSTPGSQMVDSQLQGGESVLQSSLRAAASALRRPLGAAAVGAPASGSAPSSPFFEEHSGLRMPIGDPTSCGGALKSRGGDCASDGEGDGWATVPPHRLSVQVQLCLRYSFGATASAEQIIQAAPPPYRLLSRVRAMDGLEYSAWVRQVERAWYAKLRTLLVWGKHRTTNDGQRQDAHTAAARAGVAATPQQGVRDVQPRASQQQGWVMLPTPLPPPRQWLSSASDYAFNLTGAAYCRRKATGAFVPTAVYDAYGAQSLSKHHLPHGHPVQPVMMGSVPPTAMGLLQHVFMTPMQSVVTSQVAAPPFMPLHPSMPVPVVVAPPFVGPVGMPFGMVSGAF